MKETQAQLSNSEKIKGNVASQQDAEKAGNNDRNVRDAD